MKCLSDFLWCVLFAFFAIIVSIKLNGSQTVKAVEQPVLQDLTMPKFVNPVNPHSLDVQIDLERGKAKIKSDANITTVNTMVIQESLSSKPIIKKEVVYETKTEYLTKIVTFPMEGPRFHVSSIELPKKVER